MMTGTFSRSTRSRAEGRLADFPGRRRPQSGSVVLDAARFVHHAFGDLEGLDLGAAEKCKRPVCDRIALISIGSPARETGAKTATPMSKARKASVSAWSGAVAALRRNYPAPIKDREGSPRKEVPYDSSSSAVGCASRPSVLCNAKGDRADAQGASPIELPSILSLSGPVAYAGKDEQQTIQIIEGIVNKTGGIQGHPLKVVFYDDQSNPQVAVQLMSQLIAHNAPVVLGPMFTAPCARPRRWSRRRGVMYC